MCDPLSLSIASTVAGIAGSAVNSMGAQSAAKKQQREVEIWQQQQKANRQAEQARQEEYRQEAEKAQQKGLQDVSGEAQTKRQSDEEARLAQYLQGKGDAANATPDPGAPISQSDAALSGQNTEAADPAFKSELASKINDATKSAKQRIGALARVSSFGESFGGLGTTNPLLQQAAGSAIDMQNEFRRGSLGAYNVEQAVDPVQVTYTPSPLGDIFSSALSLGAQGLGNKFGAGSLFDSTPANANVFPAAPKLTGKAATFVGPARPLPSKYAGVGGTNNGYLF